MKGVYQEYYFGIHDQPSVLSINQGRVPPLTIMGAERSYMDKRKVIVDAIDKMKKLGNPTVERVCEIIQQKCDRECNGSLTRLSDMLRKTRKDK